MRNRVYNFNAGPATLPLSVLEKAKEELLNYDNCGMSVMEISHRSKTFSSIIEETEQRIREILQVPEDYEVLFLQGGASLQFGMIPTNLYLDGKPIDVINTGSWTKKAIKEIKTISACNIIGSSEDKNYSYIPSFNNLQFNKDASYLYITSNNTIFGTQYSDFPVNNNQVPLVADMSSDIFSRSLKVKDFGVIFAGAQKNIGPSGVCLVIIRKDLVERCNENVLSMLQYRTHTKAKSLFNTPPTFTIYIINLVMKWIEESGGLEMIEKRNQEKAALLYNTIDESDFYYCPVEEESRSKMNVVFRIKGNKEDLEAQLVSGATQNGLIGLKGHRSVGGLRASIYNAHPLEGIKALTSFMKEFESKNR